MNEWPLVIALIITFKRTELAIRTIKAVKERLIYPNLGWHIADDGSPNGHVSALREVIGSDVPMTDAKRKGAGRSMNLGMRECLLRCSYILWLEDDWELIRPLDLRPCVKLLGQQEGIGMVRLAYLSPGLVGSLIQHSDQLWWCLDKGPQYTFTGHAALRHAKFCKAYGDYKEGLAPGETELWMCQHFTDTDGPKIAVPADGGIYGYFAHIGGASLANMKPEA